MIKAEKLLARQTNKPQLIPSFKKTERRLLSVFMSALNILPEFRYEIFKLIGFNSGRSSKITSHMEPNYSHESLPPVRPDGLIICSRGSQVWSAFFEAKADQQEVHSEQMQSYADLAHKLNVDTVVSISNTYTSSPSELPYPLAIGKRKKREIFHLAWPEIRSILNGVVNNGKLSETEVLIGKQILRFLNDADQGINTFDQMSKDWSDFVKIIAIGKNISNIKGFTEIVKDWEQERRDLLNKLSSAVDYPIHLKHKAGSKADQAGRMKFDKDQLGSEHTLTATYRMSETKQSLKIIANLKSKLIQVELDFPTPKSKKARASVTWLADTLQDLRDCDYYLKINWRNARNEEPNELVDFLDYPEGSAEGHSDTPIKAHLYAIQNNPKKFSSRKAFIQLVEDTTFKLLDDAKRVGIL